MSSSATALKVHELYRTVATGTREPKQFVASIDFGTTHSGTAFAVKPTAQGTADVIAEANDKHMFKEPTSALFMKDANSGELCLESFGFAARKQYKELMMKRYDESDELRPSAAHSNYVLFEGSGIKMRLPRETDENAGMCVPVTGEQQGQVPLHIVVTGILAFLKNKVLRDIPRLTGLQDVEASNCTWVLTIPAMWNAKNRNFMRRCAAAAGLVEDASSYDLKLAPEPECAAIFCYEEIAGMSDALEQAEWLLTVDCGGGTVDIISMRISYSDEDGIQFRDVDPDGGPWGATEVDKAFESFLKEFFGPQNYGRAKAEAPHIIMEIMETWEAEKKEFEGSSEENSSSGINSVKIPVRSIADHLSSNPGQFLKERVEAYNRQHSDENLQVRLASRNNMLSISSAAIGKFFDCSISEIIACIDRIEAHQEHDFIILAGGYGESKYLQKRLKTHLEEAKGELICPRKAGSAIMSGAVHYGLRPQIIGSRVAALTFGTDVVLEWQEEFEGRPLYENHRGEINGQPKCLGCFRRFVEKGQSVPSGERVLHEFHVLSDEQARMRLGIYSTDETDVSFVDEPGVTHLGDIYIDIDVSRNYTAREPPTIRCEFSFGSSEIEVKVTNERDNVSEHKLLQYSDERFDLAEY